MESKQAVTSRSPWGPNRSERISSRWPVSFLTIRPVSRSQRRRRAIPARRGDQASRRLGGHPPFRQGLGLDDHPLAKSRDFPGTEEPILGGADHGLAV